MTRTRALTLAYAFGADIAASIAAGESLPGRARWGTVALAGASAAAGVALLAADPA